MFSMTGMVPPPGPCGNGENGMKNNNEMLVQMGLAAMIPGLQRAIEIMQTELDDYRELLTRVQSGEAAVPKRGRQPAAAKSPGDNLTTKGEAVKPGYWARMTADERKTEMRRRALKSLKSGGDMRGLKGRKPEKKKLVQPNHPRNPGHPGHAAYIAKLTKAGRERRYPAKANGHAPEAAA
jgi:hypothetical protein